GRFPPVPAWLQPRYLPSPTPSNWPEQSIRPLFSTSRRPPPHLLLFPHCSIVLALDPLPAGPSLARHTSRLRASISETPPAPMALPYLEAVLCFMTLNYIFETYLNIRQHRALKLPTLPKSLAKVISHEKFEQARAYSLDKSNFNFVREAITIVCDIVILYYKVLPWFWTKSGVLVTNVGLNAENEIIHTLAFLAGVMVWSQV
uniref:CAAX prenyl protease 1 N-terminal domain-containing protein n=1 Tax=Aegilops tauschii subsp. strangulata TaxID=200361 RepID=A0A453PA43_AEGTS